CRPEPVSDRGPVRPDPYTPRRIRPTAPRTVNPEASCR
ncbi:MAG: hypothetical protein AVDCRST_MAG59-3867, partial [uncultured Thermomicrobiales bacterium]